MIEKCSPTIILQNGVNDQDEDTDDSGETQIVHKSKHNIGLELQQNSVQRFCEDDYGAEIEHCNESDKLCDDFRKMAMFSIATSLSLSAPSPVNDASCSTPPQPDVVPVFCMAVFDNCPHEFLTEKSLKYT